MRTSRLLSSLRKFSSGPILTASPQPRQHAVNLCDPVASQPSESPIHSPVRTIEQALQHKIPLEYETVSRIRRQYGDTVIGQCTVNQAYGGMRGAVCSTYETSDVDPSKGVRIRDIPITEVHQLLPTLPQCDHPTVESLLWLLLTSEVPSPTQAAAFQNELAQFTSVPSHVFKAIDMLPLDLHPMAQLSIGILALQSQSRMTAEYDHGTPKSALWRACLQDVLTLIVQQPIVAAHIYRRISSVGTTTIPQTEFDDQDDLSSRFARMMGFDDSVTEDLFRLHLTTHMDHGGGSASCFGVRVTGSTLANAFQAWSAGVNGLTGPLHGRANEEVLRWLADLQSFLHSHGGSSRDAQHRRDLIEEFCWQTLRAGLVIPGYGHTTLRATDPRFFMQKAFAQKHMADDDMIDLVWAVYDVAPKVLTEYGKVNNPWPNVDAHSGVLLRNKGLTNVSFHTVMFAVSRVLGPCANLVWDRALNLSIVRPMTVTTRWIKAHVEGDDNYVSPDRSCRPPESRSSK